MTTKDKTAERLVQSIRKTKTTSTNSKTAAVSASALPKTAPKTPARAKQSAQDQTEAPLAALVRRRVWPD